MPLDLRPYQAAAIAAIYGYFEQHTGNPLIVIPTAGGKSLVMASFIEGVLRAHPDQRMLVVTHVRELIEQNHAELKKLWPEAPAGIYSAGLKQRDIGARILFAGIQSVHQRAMEVQQCDLVLVDEAHLIPRTSNTMYRRFLQELQAINPLMKIIGLTATPYRLDSGMLHEGSDAIFTDIAYEVSVRDLIDQGYLSPMISKRTATQLDVSGVGTRHGEFIARELEEAVDREEVTRKVLDEIFELGALRRSWLIFCAGVDHAHHVRDAVRERGVSCETIVGSTPGDERRSIIEAFKRGEVRCLTNANVLTTGFNAPAVDLLAMLRPTQSPGLYVQIVGRGCRLAPGKSDCLVLDFAGNIARHGPIDAVVPRGARKGEKDDEEVAGEAPAKVCPSCEEEIPAASRQCPVCGHDFGPRELVLDTRASDLEVVSGLAPQWLAVNAVSYALHRKPASPPSMRVDYQVGLNVISEWVCLEHPGFPRRKAERWWELRSRGEPLPTRVDEALAQSQRLRRPAEIWVRRRGRFPDVLAARF